MSTIDFCTSACLQALKRTQDPTYGSMISPEDLLNIIKGTHVDVINGKAKTHTCGPLKGQPAIIEKIKGDS